MTFLRKLGRSGVSRILTGSLIGQGSVLAVSPFLTRLYGPEDFGAFALITAIASVLGGVVTLSWDRAVVVPQGRTVARAVLVLGLVSVGALGLVCYLVGWFGREWLAALTGSRVLVDYWWIAPSTITLIGIYAMLSSEVVRARHFGRLAVRNAVQGLSQAIWSVGVGLLGGPLGLLTSLAVARTAGLIGLVRRPSPDAGKLSLRVLGATLSRYRRFPLVLTWSRLINSAGLQLPTLLLVAGYGSFTAGFFALCVRVIASPIGIVVDATSQHFEGTFALYVRERRRDLTRMIVRTSAILLAVGVVPSIILAIAGPWIFQLVFGARWVDAGTMAQVLVVAYLAQFVVAPISRALVILERQLLQISWDVARAVLSIGAVAVSLAAGLSIWWCIVGLTVAQLGSYAALFFLCLQAARRQDKLCRVPTSSSLGP